MKRTWECFCVDSHIMKEYAEKASCSITNSESLWWFTQGEDSEVLCEFEDKEQLVRNLEN